MSILNKKKDKSELYPIIDPSDYDMAIRKLRRFFGNRGFKEVHTQNRQSIMAACEDPKTIATYHYDGKDWPLPQTGQMWLEYELLDKPDAAGFFCVTTSYRNEPNPVRGRHCKIFPMFEFEMPGDVEELVKLEVELLEDLGFGKKGDFPVSSYQLFADSFGTKNLTHEHEEKLGEMHGPAIFITDFPEYTSPFWNMKRQASDPTISEKVDVLLYGQETIGSAERSCDAKEMKQAFLSIEEGNYAKKLFNLFGKKRVMDELNEFLSHDFFPRSGGGIGMTRMIRAMKLSGIIK